MLAIGDSLQNRYRVVRQLGHGGMGTVYEAHDERFDISVALKEVLIDLAKIADPKQQEMVARAFEREAKTLALLHHEAFPHVIDYFSERDHQYLIMELIRGEDLGERLQSRKKPFPFEDVLKWTEQLLDALDYLHTQEHPIIHRDLKPQNLKLTERGKIKVLDFGIAKGADNKSSSTITNQTFVAATLNYSPIEQLLRVLDPTFREFIGQRHKEEVEEILEQTADARSDLYSLGATIYQLLTATQPHDTLKRALDIWSGKNDPLPNPRELNPEIPQYFSNILLKSMEIDRDNRYVSAIEMQAAIKNYLAQENKSQEENKQAAWLAEHQKNISNQPISGQMPTEPLQSLPPGMGQQTQIRIAEELKFLDELSAPKSGSKASPIDANPQSQTIPYSQDLPPADAEAERRRIAEQQKFLAELDNPSGATPAQNFNQPPPAQKDPAMTDYGSFKPSFDAPADQTNYAPINPSSDQTQVSFLDGLLPKPKPEQRTEQFKSPIAPAANTGTGQLNMSPSVPAGAADATFVGNVNSRSQVAAETITDTSAKKSPLIWIASAAVGLLVFGGIGIFLVILFWPSPELPKPTPPRANSSSTSPSDNTSTNSILSSTSTTDDNTSSSNTGNESNTGLTTSTSTSTTGKNNSSSMTPKPTPTPKPPNPEPTRNPTPLRNPTPGPTQKPVVKPPSGKPGRACEVIGDC